MMNVLSVALLFCPVADYECIDVGGCVAYIGQEDDLRRVEFRYQDTISSEGGWIVGYMDSDADSWGDLYSTQPTALATMASPQDETPPESFYSDAGDVTDSPRASWRHPGALLLPGENHTAPSGVCVNHYASSASYVSVDSISVAGEWVTDVFGWDGEGRSNPTAYDVCNLSEDDLVEVGEFNEATITGSGGFVVALQPNSVVTITADMDGGSIWVTTYAGVIEVPPGSSTILHTD